MDKRRLIVYIVTSFIASVHLGAIIPLFSFLSHDQQLTAGLSGTVAAMTPLGGLVVTFFSERVVRRLGYQRTMLVGIVSQIGLLVLLIVSPFSIALWIVVRFLLGVTFSFIFMPAQACIIVEAEGRKAVNVGLLGVVFGLGLGVGPLLTNLKTYGAAAPLVLILLLYIGILISVALVRNTFPPVNEGHIRSIPRMRILRKVWIAMLPAVLFGLIELSINAIFPMEARQRGYSVAQTSLIVALFPLFALIGQIPATLLSNKFGAGRVARYLYAGTTLVFIIPLLHYSFVSLLIVSVMGGILIGHGFYYCVYYVNSLIEKENVVRANILIESVYNIFTIFVPPLVGLFLQADGNTTIFWPLAAVSGLALVTSIIHYQKIKGGSLHENSTERPGTPLGHS